MLPHLHKGFQAMPASVRQPEFADIRQDDGSLFCRRFKDRYASSGNALAETEHVFLRGSRLASRWRRLPPHRPSHFILGETGFGTGLNFLAAWRLWTRCAPAPLLPALLGGGALPLDAQDDGRNLPAAAARPLYAGVSGLLALPGSGSSPHKPRPGTGTAEPGGGRSSRRSRPSRKDSFAAGECMVLRRLCTGPQSRNVEPGGVFAAGPAERAGHHLRHLHGRRRSARRTSPSRF